MDFGKLNDISKVDFSLPPDNQFTQKILHTDFDSTPTNFFFGPPIWANKDWIGKIYPANAKEKDFLPHFTRQFNTIELNVTHYQIPTDATIERWKTAASDGFEYCPKFPQIISHDRQLIGTEALTMEFCKAVLGLGKHLGMTFLQLSPIFEPKRLKILEKYLNFLPKELLVSVEFRHPNWFSDTNLWAETCAMLSEKNVGTVITDVAGRRDVVHQTLTTPILTLRFVGNELHPTDYSRIDAWCSRLNIWQKKGLKKAYVFVHCGENTFAPELTQYWIRQLNLLTNLQIKEPKILPKIIQGSLF